MNFRHFKNNHFDVIKFLYNTQASAVSVRTYLEKTTKISKNIQGKVDKNVQTSMCPPSAFAPS
jgi:hypothetical protein